MRRWRLHDRALPVKLGSAKTHRLTFDPTLAMNFRDREDRRLSMIPMTGFQAPIGVSRGHSSSKPYDGYQ